MGGIVVARTVAVGYVLAAPGCMGTRQQVCVERQVESRKDIAAAVTYLIPNNANDVFEDGRHVGIVANLAAYVVVIALFEVVQKFEKVLNVKLMIYMLLVMVPV